MTIVLIAVFLMKHLFLKYNILFKCVKKLKMLQLKIDVLKTVGEDKPLKILKYFFTLTYISKNTLKLNKL